MHGFRRSDDIFREFYGNNYRSFRGRRPGMHFRGFVFSRRGPGPAGAGGGKAMPQGQGRGLGRLAHYFIERLTGVTLPVVGEDTEDTIRLSPELARTGGPYAYYYRNQKKKLVVKIPPGVREGQRIRLANLGIQGRGGGPSGGIFTTSFFFCLR